jgi:Protein of unknown function (DUF3999)
MRRLLLAACVGLLGQVSLFPRTSSRHALPQGITSLEFQRGLQLAQGTQQQYVVVDETIWEHARPDLGDVRVYSGGTEVPYVLQAGAGTAVREQVDCKVLQPATVAGNTQFILDMTGTEEYDKVHLDLKTKNFVAHARIEGANDVHAAAWALLGSSSLYDFSSENLGHNSTLQIPTATFRYLRVTLDGPVKRDDVTGAKTGAGHEEAAKWVTIAERPTIIQQGRDTVISFRLSAKVPAERIHFDLDDAQPNFLRSVEVQSVDGKSKAEQLVGTGTITKIHLSRGGKRIDQEDSIISIFAAGRGTLKIIVHNGDDRPLKLTGAQLQQVERRIYFQSPAGDQATMYYGSEQVRTPSYDYTKLFQADPAAVESRLLAEQLNTAYQEPTDARPWSERHPAALWTALIATIIVLGGVAARSLRSATTQTP